jgi:hypothetical protein
MDLNIMGEVKVLNIDCLLWAIQQDNNGYGTLYDLKLPEGTTEEQFEIAEECGFSEVIGDVLDKIPDDAKVFFVLSILVGT